MKVNQITIIGLGLMGGSLGLAFSNSGKVTQVVGYDLSISSIRQAVAKGSVHWGTNVLKMAVEQADVVILAVPVGQVKAMVQKALPFLKEDQCIIFDIGSTKEQIVKEISEILPRNISFMGGHPMTGSERAGISEAHPYLFENSIFVITPNSSGEQQEALKVLENLVTLLGAKIKIMSPDIHDKIVAGVSHLPYIIAVTLMNTVKELSQVLPDAPLLAAGGFRDTTRVAGGDPIMWRDICLSNQKNIMDLIEKFQQHLEKLKINLRNSQGDELFNTFVAARESREQIPLRYKGVLPEVYELMINIPDQPGMLSLITGSLADQGVNISEIEVLRVRDNQEGAIRLAFQKKADLDQSMNILKAKGISARRR